MTADSEPKPNGPETPQGEGKTAPRSPFARHEVKWGRPPETVFQAGPLPRGERLPPLPEMPPVGGVSRPRPALQRQTAPAPPRPQAPIAPGTAASGAANIFTGSMIPRAKPAVTDRPASVLAPSRPPEEPVAAPPTPPRPVVAPDLTVRPLPPGRTVAPRPTPTQAAMPAPAQAPPLAPISPRPEPRPTPTPTPTAQAARPPLAAPRAADPSPFEETLPDTPVAARTSTRKSGPSRLPLYAGIGVAAVIGLAAIAWFVTRPGDAPVPATTPTAGEVPIEAIPAAPATLPATAPTTDSPAASVSTAPVVPADPTPVPAPTPRATPVPVRPAPAAVQPSPPPQPTVTPPPLPGPAPQPQAPPITVAPLVVTPAGPPPTAAQPAQTDPNAPVVTRPQPLE